jgi:aspartyl-tRNA(Asn)/glutamyl-tRNA(Gln) amidotransferase subunit A
MLDAEVQGAVEEALRLLQGMTKTTREVTLPSTREATLNGEVYAYHEEYYAKGAGRYMIPTRRALSRGSEAKAAEYVRSRWKLDLMRRTIDEAFNDVDLVLLPTRRRTPRTIKAAVNREEIEKARNPELENTGQFNVYGIPAISVPCGFTQSGLPIGLMIAGPRFSESRVLALGHAYEQATQWHKRKPALKQDMPVPPYREEEA